MEDNLSEESDLSGYMSDSYLHCLALLPVSFLSEEGDRFAELRGQAAIGGNYRNLFASSVWVYPMHAYMARVREQMGVTAAEAVWLLQRNMLDEADPGAGHSMEFAFNLIDKALDMSNFRLDHSTTAEPVLPENRVALALLLGMPESPDYSGTVDQRFDMLRTMGTEVEEYLAHCLLRARVELLAACSDLFENNHTGRINSNA